jgi:hypothetical protein
MLGPCFTGALMRIALRGAVVTTVSFLVACGGGSSSSPAPLSSLETPSVTLTLAAPKIFRFDWSDVRGETEYRLLENPDGSSGYGLVATLPAGATKFELQIFLPARVQARYILQACDASRCVDSSPVWISGNLTEAVGGVNQHSSEEGGFGGALAISADGSTLAVGAPVDSFFPFPPFLNNGAVYIFVLTASGWVEQTYITVPGVGGGGYADAFGAALALSADGDMLAVGAPNEDSSATGVDGDQNDDSSQESGAVYVFNRFGDDWSQQAYLKASSNEAFGHFGASLSVAADGNTLAVGAPDEIVDGRIFGAAYVFARLGGAWSEQARLQASNADHGDSFGTVAVSADGGTLAVGAPGEDSDAGGVGGDQADDTAHGSGAVYVFTRSGDVWSQRAYLKASNSDGFFSIALFEQGDEFGSSLAISSDGTTLAVGARGEDSSAVGIGGDQLDNSAEQSGAVYVFAREGDDWAQQAYLKSSNTGRRDGFGTAIALAGDGNTIVAGAPGEDSSAEGFNGVQDDDSDPDDGAAYVFARRSGVWSQIAYVKRPTPSAGTFGGSLALSSDGQTLAIDGGVRVHLY